MRALEMQGVDCARAALYVRWVLASSQSEGDWNSRLSWWARWMRDNVNAKVVFEVSTGLQAGQGAPKKRSEPKKAELPAAAPKRGRRNSAGDEGAQIAKPKSKVARQNS